MMRFRMLGPLEVQTAADWTSIGAAKWRAVLARLLLSAGQPVSTDTLIDELWGDDPPARATNLVSIYVLRLRRFIGDTDGQVLRTRPPGYLLQADDDDLDTRQFERLLGQGQQALADGDAAAAAQQRTPLIQFVGKRTAPEHASQQRQPHPAAPSESLPTTFKEYRAKATQHGPLSVGSTSSPGRIGGATGESLGPIEPPKGIAFDRDELPLRFKRLAWTAEEIEAVQSGGASALA